MLVIAAVLGPGFASAQGLFPDNAQAQRRSRSVFSETRRFLATGFSPVAAGEVVQWAERVAERIERIVGPVPFAPGEFVEIRATDRGTLPGVVREQGWETGRWLQRLAVNKPDIVDPEEALEGLAWLLLNRSLDGALAPPEIGAAWGVPEWYSVGVAQNLFPEIRDRSLAWARLRWIAGETVPARRLLDRSVMPAGRWGEKADAAALVAWLFDRTAFLQGAAPVLRAWSSDLPWGRNELAVLLGVQPRQVEQAWELWLAEMADRLRPAASLEPIEFERIEREFVVEPSELGLPPRKRELRLDALIEHRERPAAASLATRKAVRLRLLAAGRPPEFQAALGLYAAYLDAIAGRAPGYTGGMFGGKPSRRQLESLHEEAEAVWTRLRKDVEARYEYLTRIERADRQPDVDPATVTRQNYDKGSNAPKEKGVK